MDVFLFERTPSEIVILKTIFVHSGKPWSPPGAIYEADNNIGVGISATQFARPREQIIDRTDRLVNWIAKLSALFKGNFEGK